VDSVVGEVVHKEVITVEEVIEAVEAEVGAEVGVEEEVLDIRISGWLIGEQRSLQQKSYKQ